MPIPAVPHLRPRSPFALLALLLALAAAAPACKGGCGRSRQAPGTAVVGRYEDGTITEADLHYELSRLPPQLREKFDTDAGRQELVASLIDKRLLAREAAKRGLTKDPELQRQVRALEERLAIQALLAAEQRAGGGPSDAEIRAYYDAHKQELASPEQARVSRILVTVPRGATDAERTRARGRAQAFAERVKRGEPFAKVAAQGEGLERLKGGDLGLVVRGKTPDRKLEDAVFALATPGATSGVVETADGYAVLELVSREASKVPALDEVRGEIVNRLAPAQQRKTFEALLTRLRKEAGVQVGAGGGK